MFGYKTLRGLWSASSLCAPLHFRPHHYPLRTTVRELTAKAVDGAEFGVPELDGIPLRPGKLPSFTPGRKFDGFELTFLGTSSQGCARRYPSSLALRLRARAGSHVWLFDAGEGALAQMQRSHLKASQLRHIFITHMHPDHVFGLPGIVLAAIYARSRNTQVSAQASSSSSSATNYFAPLTIYGPPGLRTFLRATLGTTMPSFGDDNHLRIVELTLPEEAQTQRRYRRQSPHWSAPLRMLPFEDADVKPLRPFIADTGAPSGQTCYTYNVIELGNSAGELTDKHGVVQGPDIEGILEVDVSTKNSRASPSDPTAPASVQAALVSHSVPSVAYVITEDVRGLRFDKQKLVACGFAVDGRSDHVEYFNKLLRGESVWFNGRTIDSSDVTRTRTPRRICITGDTCDASGVAHLAQDVDVLVHEATVCAAQTHVARKRWHSSSRTAAEFAKRIRAKRLILNHTSVGYNALQVRRLEAEARALIGYDRAYVAHDMSVFNVPRPDNELDENFTFRAFLGHPRWDNTEAGEIPDVEATLPGFEVAECRAKVGATRPSAYTKSYVDHRHQHLTDDEDTTNWARVDQDQDESRNSSFKADDERGREYWQGGRELPGRRAMSERGSAVV